MLILRFPLQPYQLRDGYCAANSENAHGIQPDPKAGLCAVSGFTDSR